MHPLESAMTKIMLLHWNATEGDERARRLVDAGFKVIRFEPNADASCGRRNAPQAFVIDLSRLPSHGRAVAGALRQRKATRAVPLVFVDGDPAKVARVREEFPDATFTRWTRVVGDLRHAIAHPPANPIVPPTGDAYSATPLTKKLGIKQGSSVALLHERQDFRALLADLPSGVRIRRDLRTPPTVVLLFAPALKELRKRLPIAERGLVAGGSLWVAWPKRTSGVATDLSENAVRDAGLALGLVDIKVCAIDNTWSGLRFARRKSDATTPSRRTRTRTRSRSRVP